MEEELEEFEEAEEEEEEIKPKKIGRPMKKVAKPIEETEEELTEEEEEVKPKAKVAVPKIAETPQTQYVAVPRAVPIETMINEVYDGQQEIKQALMAILEKLPK